MVLNRFYLTSSEFSKYITQLHNKNWFSFCVLSLQNFDLNRSLFYHVENGKMAFNSGSNCEKIYLLNYYSSKKKKQNYVLKVP